MAVATATTAARLGSFICSAVSTMVLACFIWVSVSPATGVGARSWAREGAVALAAVAARSFTA